MGLAAAGGTFVIVGASAPATFELEVSATGSFDGCGGDVFVALSCGALVLLASATWFAGSTVIFGCDCSCCCLRCSAGDGCRAPAPGPTFTIWIGSGLGASSFCV